MPRTANMAQLKKKNDFKQLDWSAPSREWDIRVNLGEDYQKELEHFMKNVRSYIENVNVVYFLVGEVERGENQEHSSYEQFHVHAGLVTKDRVYPRALKEKLGLNKFSDGTSRHYYLRMRKYEYTYQGWYDHHCKPETKVNKLDLGTILGMNSIPEIEEAKRKTYCHYQYGTLPIDKKRKLDPEGKTRREIRDANIFQRDQDMFAIFESGDYDDKEMFARYGMAWTRNKANFMKILGSRPCPEAPLGRFPDGKTLCIWGPPGTGKSLYVQWKFPKAYYRMPDNYAFWDGFNPRYHTHIYYEDMDRATFNQRGTPPGQWKVWLDDQGKYNANIKFEMPWSNVRHPVIITSNFHPTDWFVPHHGIEVDKEALLRRLRVVHINDLLKEEGVRLKPNVPPHSKPEDCFEPWDYSTPTNYLPSFKPPNPQQCRY